VSLQFAVAAEELATRWWYRDDWQVKTRPSSRFQLLW